MAESYNAAGTESPVRVCRCSSWSVPSQDNLGVVRSQPLEFEFRPHFAKHIHQSHLNQLPPRTRIPEIRATSARNQRAPRQFTIKASPLQVSPQQMQFIPANRHHQVIHRVKLFRRSILFSSVRIETRDNKMSDLETGVDPSFDSALLARAAGPLVQPTPALRGRSILSRCESRFSFYIIPYCSLRTMELSAMFLVKEPGRL